MRILLLLIIYLVRILNNLYKFYYYYNIVPNIILYKLISFVYLYLLFNNNNIKFNILININKCIYIFKITMRKKT